jgi:hypothetical protein
MHAAMTEFIEAQALTDPDGMSPRPGDEEVGDASDDMHHALEAALTDAGDLSRRVRALLSVVGRAAELTATEVNAHLGQERYICAAQELTRELLERAAEHASLVLSGEEPDDDGSVRLNVLSMVARIAPEAVGAMAADFPDLTSDDPRDEPAARTRARQWVADALRMVREHQESDQLMPGKASSDAELVLSVVLAEQELPPWPIQRVVAASAEAAATLLHTASLTTLAADVFTRS